jgi:hypothetical protein
MSFAGSDLLKNKAASSLELFVPSIRPSVKSTILPPLRKFAFPELRYSSLSTQVGLILLGSTLLNGAALSSNGRSTAETLRASQ